MVAPIALAVAADTGTAVGAFNSLAASIAGAHQQWNKLNMVMGVTGAIAGRIGGSLGALQGSFSKLSHIVGQGIDILRGLGVGLEYAFSSIVKELDKIQGFQAIMSVTTKSTEEVGRSYEWLRGIADRLGVQFDALTSNYAKLVAALPQGAEGLKTAQTVFLGIADAARTLHASNNDIQLMFYAVTQMASKGTVSMEELRRQLGEKLPGTMQIAAKALNTLPETLEAAIKKGIVSSEKFLPIFGAALVRTFGDSAEQASKSVSAALNRLTNVWVDFVKSILDSGAGQSIANVFDAIREKLQDPYIVERFSTMVKFLGDKFTEFVKNLTAEDLRKGFDTFSNAIQFAMTLIEKLIGLITWIINNGAKAGAIIGGLAGASMGAVAGPWGALAGGVIGAGGGAYLGSKLSEGGVQGAQLRSQYDMSDAAVQARAEQARAAQEQYKIKMLTGPLQDFKGLNSLNGLEKLFDAARLNQQTIDDLYKILQDKSFKTDSQKTNALREYAKYGMALPQGANLADVLQPSTKKTPGLATHENSLEATWNRANGLSANYSKELKNLNELYKTGRMTLDDYTGAVEDLIMKQPFAIEMTKEATAARKMEDKALLENWKSYDAQLEVINRVNESLAEEMRLGQMNGENRQIEAQVTQVANSYREVGLKLTRDQADALREQYRTIIEINKISQAREQFEGATVNRFEQQINMLKAIRESLNDPTSGTTKQDAQNYLVSQNPDMFKGTEEYYQLQKSLAADTFAYLEALKRDEYISTETYNRLKTQAQLKVYDEQIQAADYTFGQLSTLMKSNSREAFEIGKAASVAQALINAYEAINKAWTLPYPFNIAAAAAVGAATFANVRAIASTQMGGYAGGGYTGNGGRGDVAGVVHGREYVVNSNATARHRATLEAMNSGRYSGDSGSQVNVIVNNNADGTTVRKDERQTPNGRDIEITIERVVVGQVQRGGRIASAVEGMYGLNRAAGLSR